MRNTQALFSSLIYKGLLCPQSFCCPSSCLTWFNTDNAVYLQTSSCLCPYAVVSIAKQKSIQMGLLLYGKRGIYSLIQKKSKLLFQISTVVIFSIKMSK